MGPLENKTLFITGASRGIGLAIAKRAARDGARIAIAAKTDSPNPKLEGTIHSAADEIRAVVDELSDMPNAVDLVLDTTDGVRALAREFAHATSVLFIGRHVGFPVALEGALKLKELAYMHAEGFAAGELKHGPIALIEQGVPVVVVAPSPQGRSVLHEKIVSNIQEVRARGAVTIVIAEEGDEGVLAYADHVVRVPAVPTLMQPLVSTVPLQVFACEMATVKGHDVDQPRNLAKSVTVE